MSGESSRSKPGSARLEELVEYFEKGKSFTEELMKENERLRIKALQLEKEKMDLRARLDPERVAGLLEENRKLRSRLEALEGRFDEIEKENEDFARRYVDVQAQNDNLLNLYVSSYQLHSTLDPGEVVSVIEEIILNLIGAEEYFICMIDPKRRLPVIMAAESGREQIKRGKLIDAPDQVLKEVIEQGREYYRPSDSPGQSSHLACTPLKVRDDVVGAISISKLMNQKKNGLTPIDHELLSLLADHAATALVSSQLYNKTQRKLRTVESFLELLKLEGGQGLLSAQG